MPRVADVGRNATACRPTRAHLRKSIASIADSTDRRSPALPAWPRALRREGRQNVSTCSDATTAALARALERNLEWGDEQNEGAGYGEQDGNHDGRDGIERNHSCHPDDGGGDEPDSKRDHTLWTLPVTLSGRQGPHAPAERAASAQTMRRPARAAGSDGKSLGQMGQEKLPVVDPEVVARKLAAMSLGRAQAREERMAAEAALLERAGGVFAGVMVVTSCLVSAPRSVPTTRYFAARCNARPSAVVCAASAADAVASDAAVRSAAAIKLPCATLNKALPSAMVGFDVSRLYTASDSHAAAATPSACWSCPKVSMSSASTACRVTVTWRP